MALRRPFCRPAKDLFSFKSMKSETLSLKTTQSQRLQRATQQRPYGTALSGLHEMLVGAANAGDADSLRGYEGKAAAWYWPAFKLVLDNPMGFDKRIYFPSPDPINALLSFGYALLQKDITAAVQLVGLDPYLGFFHTVQYGRPSLALDLMEEFRPVIVDRLVLRLVNWGAIRERDFVAGPGDRATPEREPLRPLAGRPPTRAQSRPISLTDAAVKRVIQAYEEVVNTPVLHPRLNERTPFRRCMTVQVQQLARVLKGEEPDYEPFVAKLAAS